MSGEDARVPASYDDLPLSAKLAYYAIAKKGVNCYTELVEHTKLSRSTLCYALDCLQKRDLVETRPDPDDARAEIYEIVIEKEAPSLNGGGDFDPRISIRIPRQRSLRWSRKLLPPRFGYFYAPDHSLIILRKCAGEGLLPGYHLSPYPTPVLCCHLQG